jgi:hypothetical protein
VYRGVNMGGALARMGERGFRWRNVSRENAGKALA